MSEMKTVSIRWRPVAGQTRFTADRVRVTAQAVAALDTTAIIGDFVSRKRRQELRRNFRSDMGDQVADALFGPNGALASSTMKFIGPRSPSLPDEIESGGMPASGEIRVTVTVEEYASLLAEAIPPRTLADEVVGEVGPGDPTFVERVRAGFVAAFEQDMAIMRLAELAYEVKYPFGEAGGYLIEPWHPWYGLSETELANRVGNVCDPHHIDTYHEAKRDLERRRRE